MANNRIIYSTAQLAIKDNRVDATSYVMGHGATTVLASGITDAQTTGIVFSDTTHWPAAGMVRLLPSGTSRVEYIRYSSLSAAGGLPATAKELVGATRGAGGTVAQNHLAGVQAQPAGWEVPLGVQSVSIGTTFALEDVFTLGQLDAYENVEGIPEIEVSIERVLDGTKPLWLSANDFDFTALKGKTADYKADIAVSVYPDTQDSATGTADSTVVASGMVVSSYSLSFVTDGNFTESMTLVGNDKTWGEEEGVPSGIFATSSAYNAAIIGSGVQRTENFDRASSTIPADVQTDDKIQSIEVSVDITREDIFELGSKTPFFRAVSFPVTVTTTIETITSEGDKVNAIGTGADNLVSRSIILVTDAGLTVNLGTNNKISSVTFEGFDAGGGNGTATFEYTNSNALTVTHTGFPDKFSINPL